MKRLLILFLSASLTSACSLAQVPSRYAETITEQSSREHLTVLASREFEGRGTGQPGGIKAAHYIADHFQQYGLKPAVGDSYFQSVALRKISYKVEHFRIGDLSLVYGKDFFVQGDNSFQTYEANDVIFVGYGIQDAKYNELKEVDVKGKVVLLINENEPVSEQGHSLLTGQKKLSEWSANRFKRIQELLKYEPLLILTTSRQSNHIIQEANNRSIGGRFHLDDDQPSIKQNTQKSPVVHITEDIADKILRYGQTSIEQFKEKANSTFKPSSTHIVTRVQASMGILTEKLDDPNVLGWMEGTDLKEEIVVICGHYDHDGILPDGTFFPGADDNGSGTVAVLELAKAFSKAKQAGQGPRRSMLFIGLAAEERGLLGSRYYVENPIFPLDSTVACINIDMIGRIDDKHLQGNHHYVHVIGTNKLSSELKPIVEKANKDISLELDEMYNDPADPLRLYYRSDHYNFAKKGIPSLFFFSGLHPHYHTPDDTVDKIDFPMMVKRERLIFHVAWDIANRDRRPIVDIPEEATQR